MPLESPQGFGREPTEFTDLQLHHFWSKVDARKDCWIWTGAKGGIGNKKTGIRYGMVGIQGGNYTAHRISWVLKNGPIPEGMYALHRCDNPLCVNPDHLFLGTQTDNMRDMYQKGRNIPALGDRNGSRMHPEKLRRGANHPFVINPQLTARGEKNGNSKLTAQDVAEIRLRHASGNYTFSMLARDFGMDNSTITDIVRREIWRHVQ